MSSAGWQEIRVGMTKGTAALPRKVIVFAKQKPHFLGNGALRFTTAD
jgi:hypothetical protein